MKISVKRRITLIAVFAFLMVISFMFGLFALFPFAAGAEGSQNVKSSVGLKMVQGASIRMTPDDSGLRLAVYMENADYTALKEQKQDVSFGILIAPKDYDDAAALDEYTFSENPVYGYAEKNANGEYVYDEAANAGKKRILNLTSPYLFYSEENDRMEFWGSLVDVQDKNIAREFIGRGYVKYTEAGVQKVEFAEESDNTYSVAFMAQKALEDEAVSASEKEFLQTTYLNKAKEQETFYTVENYIETEKGEFKLHSKDKVTAHIADKATVTPKAIAGYSPVTGEGVPSMQGTVYANGKTVFRQYYSLNSTNYIMYQNSYYQDVAISKCVSGEFEGAWKYTNTTSGAEEGNKQNWGESGVSFNTVTNPNANTAEESTGSFFSNGYHYIATEIYIENANTISLRLDGASGFHNYTEHSIALNAPYNGNAKIYNADGTPTDRFETGKWQILCLPVNYDDGYIGQWTGVRVMTNGGSVENPSVMYFRNIRYYADELLVATTGTHSGYAMVEKQYAGAFEGAWKYTNKSSGTEAGNNQNWGECGISFVGVTNPNANTAEESAGQFFVDGLHVVAAEIYIDKANSLVLQVSGGTGLTVWNEYAVGLNAPYSGNARVFNADGSIADGFVKGAWQTVYIPVDYTDGYRDWSAVRIMTNGGSATDPSVMYIRNIRLLERMPLTQTPFVRSDGEWGNYVTIQRVTSGVFAGSFKYENKSGGEADGAEKQNWSESGMLFTDVTYSPANSERESTGKFFDYGYKWIKLDVNVASGTSLSVKSSGTTGYTTNYWKQKVGIGARTEDLYLTTVDGVTRLDTLEYDTWTTLYIPADHEDGYLGWTDVFVMLNGGTTQNPAIMYVKNITYLENVTLPDFVYTTYYFDAENGDDSANGLSPQTAKKTVSAATTLISSSTTDMPLRVLFKAGSTFEGTLYVGGNSSETYPLILDAYDRNSANPYATFTGSANGAACIEVYRGNIEISYLECTNSTVMRGIHIRTNGTAGASKNITVRNCYVHDLNFDLTGKNESTVLNGATLSESVAKEICPNDKYVYNTGGIIFEADTTEAQGASWFENITIENNRIEKVSRTGIWVFSNWVYRPGVEWGINKYYDDETNWFPHSNITISGNNLSFVGGDGIVLGGTIGGQIDHNICYHAQILGRSDYYNAGIWVHSSKRVTIEYNESAYTHTGYDGEGFDIDIGCSDIYFRYNYSHHNEGGGLLMCNTNTDVKKYDANGNPVTDSSGNQIVEKREGDWHNVYVTNNIFADNTGSVYILAGYVRNVYIENNTAIIPSNVGSVLEPYKVINAKEFGESAKSENINFTNNIFYFRSEQTNAKFDMDYCNSYTFGKNMLNAGSTTKNRLKNFIQDNNYVEGDPGYADTSVSAGITAAYVFTPTAEIAKNNGDQTVIKLEKDYKGTTVAEDRTYFGAIAS